MRARSRRHTSIASRYFPLPEPSTISCHFFSRTACSAHFQEDLVTAGQGPLKQTWRCCRPWLHISLRCILGQETRRALSNTHSHRLCRPVRAKLRSLSPNLSTCRSDGSMWSPESQGWHGHCGGSGRRWPPAFLSELCRLGSEPHSAAIVKNSGTILWSTSFSHFIRRLQTCSRNVPMHVSASGQRSGTNCFAGAGVPVVCALTAVLLSEDKRNPARACWLQACFVSPLLRCTRRSPAQEHVNSNAMRSRLVTAAFLQRSSKW